ncbi:hypothetical protein M0R72_10705 [Candidatus Pacearchaeota archaeon]|jgi:hypothetical protein|nr:hypothetical protein [Candidatus Pacearchaeota archaeon]
MKTAEERADEILRLPIGENSNRSFDLIAEEKTLTREDLVGIINQERSCALEAVADKCGTLRPNSVFLERDRIAYFAACRDCAHEARAMKPVKA